MFFRLPTFLPLLLLSSTAAIGQQPADAKQTKPKEDGIPVTDPLTVAKCGACHKQDDKGSMTRISWDRTTPEGWEQAIKRMVRLNGLSITPEEARKIVKYLS